MVLSKSFGFLSRLLSGGMVRADCGHEVTVPSQIVVDGTLYGLGINPGNKISSCWECIRCKSINCAWCGKEIMLGFSVSLQTPCEDMVALPDAVSHSDQNVTNALVGCLRESCAQSDRLVTGLWIYPGVVESVKMRTIETYQT